jgi:hypothetical protein
MRGSQLAQAEQNGYALRAKLGTSRQAAEDFRRAVRPAASVQEATLPLIQSLGLLLPVNGQVGFQQEFTDNDVRIQHLLVCVIAMSIAANGE